MPDVLQYFGRDMRWEPQNWADVPGLLQRVARQGESFRAEIEPGDGTRYDLWITVTAPSESRARFLIVSRLRSGGAGPTCAYSSDDRAAAKAAIEVLAEGNGWSAMFFTWWFDGLLLRLANVSAKEANI